MKALHLATFSLAFVACAKAPHTSHVADDSPGTQPTWEHAYLASTDRTQLAFDYQSASQSDPHTGAATAWTTSAWLNVANANFTGNEKVRVVIANYSMESQDIGEEDPQVAGNLLTTLQIDLTYDTTAKKFTAPVPTLQTYSFAGEGDDVFFESFLVISIVVNGTWLTDPVNGAHNFEAKIGPY